MKSVVKFKNVLYLLKQNKKDMRPILNKVLICDKEVVTGIDNIMFNPDGIDSVIEAEVIEVGTNITDISAGDTIIYPKSRGVRAVIDGTNYNVIEYQTILLIKKEKK